MVPTRPLDVLRTRVDDGPTPRCRTDVLRRAGVGNRIDESDRIVELQPIAHATSRFEAQPHAARWQWHPPRRDAVDRLAWDLDALSATLQDERTAVDQHRRRARALEDPRRDRRDEKDRRKSAHQSQLIREADAREEHDQHHQRQQPAATDRSQGGCREAREP